MQIAFFPFVIAGRDPAIHGAAGAFAGRIAPVGCDAGRAMPMDRRVEPGDDSFIAAADG